MIALLAAAMVQAAAPVFAPPLDQPIRYNVVETRIEEERTQRFEVVRRVTFHAVADGVTAEIETLSVTGSQGGAGRLFEAMTRSTIGRRVTLTLDRSGRIVDVADLDMLWDAQLSAMGAALASQDPARQSVATRLLAPLQSLPRGSKMARLGEMVAPLIADPITAARDARAITIPTRAADGTTALLPGTERVLLERDGTLRLNRRADGEVGGAMTTIVQERHLDPRTGMALATDSTTKIEIGGARLIVARTSAILP